MPPFRTAAERYGELIYEALPRDGSRMYTADLMSACDFSSRYQVYAGVTALRREGFPVVNYYGSYALALDKQDIEDGYHRRFLRDYHSARITVVSMITSMSQLLTYDDAERLRGKAQSLLTMLYDLSVNGRLPDNGG